MSGSKLMGHWVDILVVICALGLGFVGLVRYLERTSVFYPARQVLGDPSSVGLKFDEVNIATSDGLNLHGWLIPSPQSKAVMLFFHGNAGNIGDRIPKILFWHELGWDVLIVDYRGYGQSQGTPTIEGIYEDAIAVDQFVRQDPRTREKKVVIYGCSLGGAVAVDLASRQEPDGLILDSTFANSYDMARMILPFVPEWILKVRMNSDEKIQKVSAPKVFIHSVEDDMIPYRFGKKLFDAAPEPKQFVDVTGGHNDYLTHSDAQKVSKVIRDFQETYGL